MTKKRKMVWVLVAVVLLVILPFFAVIGGIKLSYVRERNAFAEAFEGESSFMLYEGVSLNDDMNGDPFKPSRLEGKLAAIPGPGSLYAKPLGVTKADEEMIRQTLAQGVRAWRFSSVLEGELACLFHPDYMLESVTRSGDRYQLWICFSCWQTELYVNGRKSSVEFVDFMKLKELIYYRAQQRPLSEDWCEDARKVFRSNSIEELQVYRGATRSRVESGALNKSAESKAWGQLGEGWTVGEPMGGTQEQLKVAMRVLENGVSPIKTMESGGLLFPAALAQDERMDYVLEWTEIGSRFEWRAYVNMREGMIVFYDKGVWKVARLSEDGKEGLKRALEGGEDVG